MASHNTPSTSNTTSSSIDVLWPKKNLELKPIQEHSNVYYRPKTKSSLWRSIIRFFRRSNRFEAARNTAEIMATTSENGVKRKRSARIFLKPKKSLAIVQESVEVHLETTTNETEISEWAQALPESCVSLDVEIIRPEQKEELAIRPLVKPEIPRKPQPQPSQPSSHLGPFANVLKAMEEVLKTGNIDPALELEFERQEKQLEMQEKLMEDLERSLEIQESLMRILDQAARPLEVMEVQRNRFEVDERQMAMLENTLEIESRCLEVDEKQLEIQENRLKTLDLYENPLENQEKRLQELEKALEIDERFYSALERTLLI